MINTLFDREVRQRILSSVARRMRKCAKGEDLILTVHSRFLFFNRAIQVSDWVRLRNRVHWQMGLRG